MSLIQRVKDRLVALGPGHPLVRVALKAHAARRGFHVGFGPDTVRFGRGAKEIVLRAGDFTLVPVMIELFDSMTDIVEPTTTGSRNVFDFSRKAVHRYPARGLEFVSPGIPEDDSIAAYTYRYHPRPGDVVFDLGAHAGFTTYFFSTMVGDGGRVVAFEPDGTARDALLENIARHGLRNVTVEPLAMSDQTGTAVFNADGSMAAGLLDHAVYTDARKHTRIETVTLADYCARAGVVPAFIKIDIEGSEVAVVRSSLDFLRKHKVHLAIESFHRLKDGTLTYTVLGEPLQSIGYTVESSDRFGQMFTWATPPA